MPDRLSILNCTEDELKVELSKPTTEAGKAALDALERALQDYKDGLIDVLVTAPINKIPFSRKHSISRTHRIYRGTCGRRTEGFDDLLKNDFVWHW